MHATEDTPLDILPDHVIGVHNGKVIDTYILHII